jgi:hypothetical protein
MSGRRCESVEEGWREVGLCGINGEESEEVANRSAAKMALGIGVMRRKEGEWVGDKRRSLTLVKLSG